MKKLFKNFLMLTAVGAMAFLYSCSEEDEPTAAAPSISVSAALADGTAVADAAEVISGSVLTLSVSATTPGGFNVIRYDAGSNTLEITRTDLQLDAGATSASTTIPAFTVPEEAEGASIQWSFEVVDDLNQTGTASFTINVVAPPSPDANTGMNQLFGQLNSAGGSFYDLMNDEVYGYAAASTEQTANVDFAFFYGSTSGYAIAALADESLQTAFEAANVPIDGVFDAAEFNETLFKALDASADDFDGVVSEADIANLFGEVAADATNANSLEVGSVFGFTLDGEKRQGLSGLMKITETGGDTGASRTISFEIKYTSPVQ